MKELQVTQFIEQLASKAPTPGGGAAAAVSAGLGIGAILMAMEFSVTKKMSAEDRQVLQDRIQAFHTSKDKFIAMIDRDATEFEPLAQAYRMPKDDASQIEARQQAIQEGLVTASAVPMDLIEEVGKILQNFDAILPFIKKTIVSDIGVGLQQLRAALQASALNLYINAGQLSDPDLQTSYRHLASDQVDNFIEHIDQYFDQVKAQLIK